jgi:hypothetical protein
MDSARAKEASSRTVEGIRASDFIDSIGVNVHLRFVPGKYADISKIISDLEFLGIHRIRDVAPNPDKPGFESYGKLAEAGVKLSLLAPGWELLSEAVANLKDFAVRYPGALSAIEGPNEVNNFPLEHKGKTGVQAAVSFQNDLYATVRSEPAFGDLPIYHLTAPPGIAGRADFANVHPYPKRGDQPLRWLSRAIGRHLPHFPGLTPVITETGYYTLPGGPGWEGVDETTQAKLTLNLLFDAAKLGVDKVYLYALLDAYPDPDRNKMNQHFGLFAFDGDPKPAASAIHNLTTLLRDPGSDAESFQPGRLSYSVSGLSAKGDSLVIQKSSGTFVIVIWEEPDIWDEDADRPILAATRRIRLGLESDVSEVRIYDPLIGTFPIGAVQGTNEIVVDVSDHPIIVEVGPALEY